MLFLTALILQHTLLLQEEKVKGLFSLDFGCKTEYNAVAIEVGDECHGKLGSSGARFEAVRFSEAPGKV
jgi:hypothetical protein